MPTSLNTSPLEVHERLKKNIKGTLILNKQSKGKDLKEKGYILNINLHVCLSVLETAELKNCSKPVEFIFYPLKKKRKKSLSSGNNELYRSQNTKFACNYINLSVFK